MSNTDTVNSFFTYFDPTKNNYLPNNPDINSFMKTCFAPDAGTKPPSTPSVGIGANVVPQGPQFYGYNAVYAFFDAMISSFPNLNYAAAGPLCYSSKDGNKIDANPVIIVQTILKTGALQAPWLPVDNLSNPPQQFYSKPLSDIEVEPDATKKKKSNMPACAVFTFDKNSYILNLAIYMDRWQVAVDLWRGTPQPKFGGRPFPTP